MASQVQSVHSDDEHTASGGGNSSDKSDSESIWILGTVLKEGDQHEEQEQQRQQQREQQEKREETEKHQEKEEGAEGRAGGQGREKENVSSVYHGPTGVVLGTRGDLPSSPSRYDEKAITAREVRRMAEGCG